MTLITDQSEFLISIGESLSNPKGTVFKTKNKDIKFGLFKGKEYLGMGEFIINNEVRWVSIHNSSPIKQNNNELLSLCDSLRLRIKCSPNVNSRKASNQTKMISLQNTQSSDDKKLKKSTPQFDTHLLGSDKKNKYITKITPDTSYVKSKTGRISQNRSKNHDSCNILNTDIYSSYNTLNSRKVNKIKKSFCNKTKGSYRDLRSLSAITTNGRAEYRTHLAQKHFKKISLNVPHQVLGSDNGIINKSFENNIEKDSMIHETTNDLSNIAPIEEHECLLDPFTTLKDDFFILYEDGYLTQVPLDTIQLEAELFIEKVSEMQCKYHQVMKEMNKHFLYYNSKAKELNDLLMKITKKRNKLRLISMENEYIQMVQESYGNLHQILSLTKEELSIWHRIMRDSNKNLIDKIKKKDKTEKWQLKEIILSLINRSNNQEIINKLNVYQKYFLDKIMQNATKALKPNANVNPNNIDQTESTINEGQKHISSSKENTNTMINQYSVESILSNMNSTTTNSTTKFPNKKKGLNEVEMKKAKSKYLFFSKYHKYN